jgi:hypothetical protein
MRTPLAYKLITRVESIAMTRRRNQVNGGSNCNFMMLASITERTTIGRLSAWAVPALPSMR